MTFDAADFLTGLSAGSRPEPAPKLLFPEPVDAPAADPFAGWVRRPDHQWRMGWEPADTPEWMRWWARSTFEDLPEVPTNFYFGQPGGPTP